MLQVRIRGIFGSRGWLGGGKTSTLGSWGCSNVYTDMREFVEPSPLTVCARFSVGSLYFNNNFQGQNIGGNLQRVTLGPGGKPQSPATPSAPIFIFPLC